ncbi:DUF6422 family protein [Streptomyces sp. MA5143a]|uniref:DUF6422 family protein n=1 Tax=Streptomyces sp. MA5143a TaxID=2083010 RepID=UPI000D1A19FA|nr:DUF6422 family protein [Streptomyces sp. MA5143a]SPF05477.1 hypothetical protein SMA5143A_6291 [Streptomyces sp. MA5143a]
MSDPTTPIQMPPEQAKALAEAASLVVNAQREARKILQRAGVEVPPEEVDRYRGCFGCLCSRFKGDFDRPCINEWIDLRQPDYPLKRRCAHPYESHWIG